jgi:urea transport system permease protein
MSTDPVAMRVATALRAVLLLLLLALVPLAAWAADLDETLAALASGGFEEREQAVAALGASGDPRAAAILQALDDGALQVTEDKRVLIAKDSAYLDPLTGTAVEISGEPERIRVNNRLRNEIEAALAQLNLFSPDPAQRLAAASAVLHAPDPAGAPVLERALATEKNAGVADALRLALAATALQSGDVAAKLKAIHTLGGSTDPEIRRLLGEVADTADAPEIKAAATEALGAIARRNFRAEIAANIFQGVSLGSVLLLAAIGLAITFGVMGVINMAHGEMIMLGAYATYVVQEAFRAWLPASWFDLYLIAAVPVGFLTAALVGAAIERGIIRFLYGRPLETLLATWGISLMLQQAVRSIFGAPNKEVSNPAWMTGGFDLAGGFTVTWNRVVIIGFSLAVFGLLTLVLRRTSLGLHIRAVTQNRRMAAVVGIPTGRVDMLTFALGSGIAGIAGVALSQISNVSPNLGTIYIIDSFMVVVFGGVGNLAGTLAGAMGLGIANKLLEPFAGAVLGKIVILVGIILFIQFRPRGLFALKGRAVES